MNQENDEGMKHVLSEHAFSITILFFIILYN